MFLYKSDKNYVPISWKSRETQQVVRSTLAAETLAMEEALEECYLIRSTSKFITEMLKVDCFLYIATETVNRY